MIGNVFLVIVGAASVSIAEPQNPKGYCGFGAFTSALM